MLSENHKTARILIVDDQEANVRLLEQMLRRAGYGNIVSTQDSRNAIPLWEQSQPDLILLDLHMPHVDGYTVLSELKARLPDETYLPILVLTADGLTSVKQRALSLGATDFLTKPFDVVEVLLRIRNLLETRFLHLNLEHKVLERTRDLEQAQIEMLERLALASESRDDDTGHHTQRVGQLAAALASKIGWPEAEIETIRRAAELHDIGKIGIPDHILLKPAELTPEEFELMKTHSALGAKILAGSRFAILQLAEQIAHYHHEKWDGRGYYGIAGEDIPLAARIVAVADVFDVLTHSRPYKDAWPLESALDLIRRESGHHFDPQLAACFLEIVTSSSLTNLGNVLRAEVACPTAAASLETQPL